MVGIVNDWTAFQFDSAALNLGRIIENALAENARKKKAMRQPPENIINRILGFGKQTGEVVSAGRFADIRKLGPGRKMKVPESGVW